MLLLSKSAYLKYIPDSRSTEISPFMVDRPDRGSSMSAIISQSSRLSFHLLICTDGSFLSHWAVFSFQTRGDFGGYLVLLSHPPPVSFQLTQWSRTQAICQGVKLCLAARNIYPNIYISYYCLYTANVVICYLFFGEHPLSQSSLIPGEVKKKKPKHFLFLFFILGQSWFNKTPINSLLIWSQQRHLRGWLTRVSLT